MALLYRSLFPAMWLSWAIYWFWAARHAKATERREPIASRLLHIVPLLVAVWLLWGGRVSVAFLNERLFPWAPWEFWIGALVTAPGLLFTVWARIHLGRNWSGTVTIKQGHELIETGPYALVRHPIYTGLRGGYRPVARSACRPHCMGGLLAEGAARRTVDGRAIRRTLSRLLPAHAGPGALLEMEANVRQARLARRERAPRCHTFTPPAPRRNTHLPPDPFPA
jgi:protein-S-isoprenylcysteine O-methyltransferase Ste14